MVQQTSFVGDLDTGRREFCRRIDVIYNFVDLSAVGDFVSRICKVNLLKLLATSSYRSHQIGALGIPSTFIKVVIIDGINCSLIQPLIVLLFFRGRGVPDGSSKQIKRVSEATTGSSRTGSSFISSAAHFARRPGSRRGKYDPLPIFLFVRKSVFLRFTVGCASLRFCQSNVLHL